MISGSCHCRAVSFTVAADAAPGEAIECNCSHCSAKGLLLWFQPAAAVTVTAPEGQLTTYRFNKHVIQHQFCRTCGTQPFGFGTGPDGSAMAAVNVRCLDGIDLGAVVRLPYDGKNA